ncbi:MAG: mechanosensitive ion channel family protein [Lentisphaeraceae bacterium]|nr:mechanosensitive ion channel family protein [Lentisphaeraceae bacterium]
MKDFESYYQIPVIILGCWLLSVILKSIFNKFIESRRSSLDIDPTNFYFLRNGISFVIYTIGIVIVFMNTPGFQGFGTTIFASAGLFAAIVGFASKEAFANIVSGIFIIIFKPFRVNDLLEFENNQRGFVEDITLRHTVIKDLNNKRIIIPNSTMSSESIINYHISDKRILFHYKVGISYESNVEKATELIQNYLEARKDVLKWEGIDGSTRDTKARIRVTELYDSGVTLRADYWCEDYDTAFNISCLLNKELLILFKENGIEIPYPHRTLVFKDGEPGQAKAKLIQGQES